MLRLLPVMALTLAMASAAWANGGGPPPNRAPDATPDLPVQQQLDQMRQRIQNLEREVAQLRSQLPQPPGPGGPPGNFAGFGPGGFANFAMPGTTLDDGTPIQAALEASKEEWVVINSKLQKIIALRAQVDAAIDPSMPVNMGFNMGMFGSDSMDAPNTFTMPGGMVPGRGGPGQPPGGQSPAQNPPAPNDRGGGGGGGGGGPRNAPSAMLLTAATADRFIMAPGGAPGNGNTQFGPAPANAPQAPGGAGTRGGPGQGPGPGGPPPGAFGGFSMNPNNAVMTLLTEMQTLLADDKATDDQIKEKLAAIRATRNKARSDLHTAEEDLRRLLTTRQEAILAGAGYLD